MMELAPGFVSTTMGCPMRAYTFSATTRACTSVEPGTKGTIQRTGLTG